MTKGDSDGVVLLSGGNPQIAKGDGDEPVQAYLAAMPGWKGEIGRHLDDLIGAGVVFPGVSQRLGRGLNQVDLGMHATDLAVAAALG